MGDGMIAIFFMAVIGIAALAFMGLYWMVMDAEADERWPGYDD